MFNYLAPFYFYIIAIAVGIIYFIKDRKYSFANKLIFSSVIVYLALLVSLPMENNPFVDKFFSYRWYVAIFILFISMLLKGPALKLNFLSSLLIAYNIFMYFSCWQSLSPTLTFYRSTAFSLMILVIFFLDKNLIFSLMKKFWDFIYFYNPAVTVLLSLPYVFYGGYFFFNGIIGNSNGLAVVIGIGLPYLYANMLDVEKKQIFYKIIFVLILFITFLAHSRSILIGVMAGILFVTYKKRKGFLKIVIFCCVCLGVLSYVLEMGSVGNLGKSYILKAKGNPQSISQGNITAEDLFKTERTENIQLAKKYFLQNSLFGWGYGISPEGYYDEWAGELTLSLGTLREKGTSWLATLEELGIIGSMPLFICLFLLYRIIFSKVNFISKKDETLFYGLCGSNIVMIVNATTEAWIASPGAFVFFIFWFNSFCLAKLYWSSRVETSINPKSI